MQDTLTGFLLTGVGDISQDGEKNYFCVSGETDQADIRIKFTEMTCRDDMTLILMNQWVADKISDTIAEYDQAIPSIVVIPTKDKPHCANSDPLCDRVNKLLFEKH